MGGTKIAAGVVDGAGRIHSRVQRPTDKGSPQIVLSSIVDAITGAIAAAGCSTRDTLGVGLGIPGMIDPVKGMATSSINLGWRDTPVATAVAAAVGLRCFIENDVKAATLGEWRYGAARGARNVVYLSIGTGIAAGILIEGKLYRGAHGTAGDVGQAIVDPGGPLCKCGSKGCLEALASGPAIAGRATLALDDGGPSLLDEWRSPGSPPLTAREVMDAAAKGDPIAQTVLEATSKCLAFAVRWLIAAFDPELVILGGGVALAGLPLLCAIRDDLIRQADESWVFKNMFRPESLRLSDLKTDAGILGAAALVEA